MPSPLKSTTEKPQVEAPVADPAVGGPTSKRWSVGLSDGVTSSLEIVFEQPATKDEAIAKFKETMGVRESVHPFSASPIAEVEEPAPV